MDCLEFRRHLLADPYSQAPEFVAHKQACPDCRGAAQRAKVFESKLRRAFDVPVPDELADQILLGQTTSARQSHIRNGWFMALAATVVIGVGLAAALMPNVNDGLRQSVVDHMRHEPEAMLSTTLVSQDEVRALFGYYGVEPAADLAGVTFAAPCAMYQGAGVHLVVRGDEGPPVTVLYMPDVEIDDRVRVNLEGFDGVITPLARGALAIVGYEGQTLDGVETLMRGVLNIGI